MANLFKSAIMPISVVCICMPAHGQDAPVMDWSYMAWDGANQAVMESIVKPSPSKLGRAQSRTGLTTEVPAINSGNLIYTPSLVQRRKNLAAFVSKTRAQDPKGADNMERLFANTDVISAIGRGIAPMGLQIDNVADAYTVYWITAWEASKGIVNAKTSRAQSQAVKRQASSALLSTQEFQASSAAQKQELAEALLVQAALIQAMSEKYASDPDMMSKTAAAVRQGAKAMGLDLEKMTLTPNGFVATGKIGSVDDAPRSPVPQQVASVPGPASDDSLASYALIAAAGGAGIAAVFLAGKAMGKKG